MNWNEIDWLTVTINATFLMLIVSLLCGVYRLVVGPSLSDRVVALDLITVLTVGVIAVDAIARQQPVFLRVAIVIALITFLGTIAFAYYLEKRGFR